MAGEEQQLTVISLIVPAHNAAKTLDRALSSVRAQSFADWEAIVVDDGSVDRTAAVAQAHADTDPRIRLIRQAQGGVSTARNAGLAAATGDWVLFLDSDDAIAPDHLAAMLDAAAAAPDAGLLHCSWRRVVNGEPWRAPHPAPTIADPMATAARTCPFAIHAALTRRERIAAAGGFDPALRIAEDWDLWQRLARIGVDFAAVPGVTVDVYVEPGSLSSDSARHLSDGLRVMRRGHGVDERLPADVPFAQGAPAPAFAPAAWHFAIWVAAAGLGRGADPVALIEQADLPAPPGFDAAVLATLIEDGLAIGAGPAIGPLYAAWPRFEPGICALVDAIARRAAAPLLADQLYRALEDVLARSVPPGIEARIGALAIVAIDVTDRLRDRALPGATRMHVTLTADGRPLADMGTHFAFGALSASRQLAMARTLEDSAELRADSVRAMVRRGPLALGLPLLPALKQYARLMRSLRNPHIHQHAKLPHEDVRDLFLRTEPDGRAGIDSDSRVAQIVAEARAPLSATQDAAAGSDEPWVEPDYTREDYWEGLFAKVDPWGYRNDYETVKYEQTLDLVRDVEIGIALEIACAEGEFTRRLAALAGHVLATDIAPTAVARAAEACADLANCSFQRLDLLTEEPPGSYDLIVASEVLYYLDPPAMQAFVAKVERHLNPGGIFLTAHGNLLVDEPDRTGFGWPHHFGAKGIGSIVLANGNFALETELWTPLYRIMRFRKAAPETVPPANRIVADAARNLPERVAAQVKWRGGHEAPVTDDWHEFPILMYHRIADDGPAGLAQWRTTPAAFEAQLRHLRDDGWQGVSFQRMREAAHLGWPMPGKRIMLTFDDATRDFMDVALPLLHRYGFPATLFVPTGHVGTAAVWDAAHGDPAPLLDWNELRMLKHCDVTLASHSVTHRPLTVLEPEAVVRELAESRFRLEQELGEPVTGIAYPYGAFDQPLREAAQAVGYEFGFTCFDGMIAAHADPLALFRREVKGGIDLAQFAALIEGR
jgi:peptidoglycan/xylan/chitin deacetylase (PgdA/CDA1 family)/SAM-dependent methyltransferase/CTP:molybdopterin cytidylyltransferase MocA